MFMKNLLIVLSTTFIVTLPQTIFADGCFVTDNYGQDVYAPDQKVAIVWDGENETMILSTKVQSKDLANFGWIIPIKARSKPAVELGDVQIFYDLSDYFKPPRKKVEALEGLTLSAGGFDSVEVLETKQLEIYDITILKATDAKQLFEWLKVNDFKVFAELQEILSMYTNKDFFFVTAKIDLLNKYREDIEILKRQEVRDDIAKVQAEIKRSRSSYGLVDPVIKDILLNKNFEQSVISKSDLNERYKLLSKEEYEKLRKQYGIGDIILRIFRLDSREEGPFIDVWFKKNIREITFYNGRERVILFKRDRGSFSKHYGRHTDKELYNADELREMKEYFAKYAPAVGDKPRELSKYLKDKFYLKNHDIQALHENEHLSRFNKIENVKKTLAWGLYYPLKMSFETTQPFFPLRISSVNKGEVSITAYIFSNSPMKDRDGILKIAVWKELSQSFGAKVSKYIPVRNCKCVSKLTFGGMSSEFVADVKFDLMSEKEQARYSQEGVEKAKQIKEDLKTAVGNGDIETVKRLIATGLRVDGDYGGNLIHTAVNRISHGQNTKEVIAYLLSKGANINTLDDEGYGLGLKKTPLCYAIQARATAFIERYLEVAEFLIDNGAVLNVEKLGSRSGGDMLVCAATHGKKNVVELLVQHGVNINYNSNNIHYGNALQEAAKGGHVEVAKLLIEHGADINAGSRIGSWNYRPIDFAAEQGKVEMVTLLLEHGADANNGTFGTSRPAPLSAAAEAGHKEVVKILLKSGVNVNGTSLWYATKAGRIDMVKLLLENGLDPNIEYVWKTPLQIAKDMGFKDIVELLERYGGQEARTYVGGSRPIIFSDKLDGLKLGMTQDEVIKAVGRGRKLPTSSPNENVWCYYIYLQTRISRHVSFYLIFKNNLLVKYGRQPVLAEYIHRNIKP